MNIYFGSSNSDAWSVKRIISALDKYLPAGMQKVNTIAEADLVVLHVTGKNQHTTRAAQEITAQGKKVAVIQYALKSTRNPNAKDWDDLWKRSKVVWSYYDLSRYTDNFYHAPLGAGSELFYPQEAEKKYLVGTIGTTYQAECIGEVQLATWRAGGRAFHVGTKFSDNPIVDYFSNISDDEMRLLMNSCLYFACLRRKEGFEMPAVEALKCGIRPIMFDTPNYRQWFDGLAEFIPETTVEGVAEALRRILKKNPRAVTSEEHAIIDTRFDWRKIVEGFWDRCL